MTAHAEHLPPHSQRGRHDAQEHSPKKPAKWLFIGGIVVLLAAAITVTVMVLMRRHGATKERDSRQHELAKGPHLTVVQVQQSRAMREVNLPGEVKGFNQSTLYAKVSGYVKEMRVDRGDRVKAGQILAVIESPEIQQDVKAAQSQQVYAKRTSQRMNTLAGPGVVSMLERDNALNDKDKANADLSRAEAMLDYTFVRAPFDGVVTARYVDPGALVPAATTSTQAAQPVLEVSDIDRVRVFTYVGQDVAAFVKAGDKVSIVEDERPAQRISAEMTRVTQSLDPRTRTMQCEVDIDNRVPHLVPGTFVHVHIGVVIPPSAVVPNDALVTRDGVPHVAIVENNKVHYVPVEVGLNDGKSTRIEKGLSGGEMVGLNVPVQIDDGDTVQAEPQKNKSGTGAADQTSAKGSPTSTPTSTARPQAPGPVPQEKNPEPNMGGDNGIDAGKN